MLTRTPSCGGFRCQSLPTANWKNEAAFGIKLNYWIYPPVSTYVDTNASDKSRSNSGARKLSQPSMQTIELSNVQATRIALDPSGQHIALAGVHDLTVLSLERSSQPHSISLNAKSDPAGLQWHPNDSSRLAVLRNNRCELLLWDAIEGRVSVSHRLSGYVRPLSSLNWSSLQPYMLATSSADQFRAICLWDLRDLSRPARAIESLSPPNLIKWNKTQSLKFASSHRSSIRVWDMRSPAVFRESSLDYF